MSGKCKKYTPEFREQAARLVIETGRVGIQDSKQRGRFQPQRSKSALLLAIGQQLVCRSGRRPT